MASEPITQLTGFGFLLMREMAGYSRRAFADWMQQRKAETGDRAMRASYSSIRTLEEEDVVPLRYVRDLRQFLGHSVFTRLISDIRRQYPEAIID